MGLFSKKCAYCRNKIEKGKEIKRDVKVPGYIGTHSNNFCCEEHVNKYEQEMEEYTKKSKKSGGCCG
ncbi:hypothetical protein HY643_02185 [Candidatus Woesearchaeota archaeon]|nr:hypothetical protein [Candidatus Woesearchaeota archaeon]